MTKLYQHLHTAFSRFKKSFFSIGLLLILTFCNYNIINAQCLPLPVVNAVANQVVCNNTATTNIIFSGTATSYNWTNTTTSIGLAASGTGNIASFTAVNSTAAAVTATITVTPVTGVCIGSPITFTITVNPSPSVSVTPVTSCGGSPSGIGPCNPLTGSGADSYIWSPVTGLYTNCAATAPYTGGNVATVFASPTANTVYTVTGITTATGCAATATATVKYTPPAPVVTPAAVSMCLSDPPVKIKIAPLPGTSQFCSGPLSIAVPDNSPAGLSHTITVSGVPASCLITGITVNINMLHTRISDMVFVLRGPNGQIINLDYRLSATANTGLTTGFTNTVFSSTGTASLATGINPYTGTFKADAQIAAVGGLGAPGPTAMQPTISNWGGLFINPNGGWTLGFYDGATGETGTLTSWCINLSYACGNSVPATPATWSPMVGLFRDPAATIPYTGDAVDSIWAKPLPAGTYIYQVTTQGLPGNGCVSPPRSVTVTVGLPNAITAQPANQKVCLGNDAHFTVTATGSGLNYQWQQTSNGGATFINLVNAGIYSGATSPTLTITAPPLSMNNYYYRVIVSGSTACGAVVSVIDTLTVKPTPVATISAYPYLKLLPGLTTTLSSVVTPTAVATYTWIHDGIAVPGASADTLLVDFTGVGFYQLSVVDINGCSALSNTIEIKDSTHGRIFLFPNPSNGAFQMRYYSAPNTSLPRTLVVYDNHGNRILTKAYTQTISYQRIDIDVRKNGKGLYLVELLDKDGKQLGMSKIMVQ